MTVEKAKPLTEAPEMSAMYSLGEPGQEHELLARLAGDWSVVMTIFDGTGAVVSTSEAMKSRKRLILGGRQVMEEIHEGRIAGVEHRKVTLLGYNAVNQRFEFVTADNMDTQQMVYRGVRDPSGTVVMTANYTQAALADIVSGDGMSRASGTAHSNRAAVGIQMNVRDELIVRSGDSHVLRMFFHPATGLEALGVEYSYQRDH